MRIISFTMNGASSRRPRVGALLDKQHILDFERANGDRPESHLEWFNVDGPWFSKARGVFDELLADAGRAEKAAADGTLVRRQDAYWLAPVPRPGKLICIGLNYRDHAAELNLKIPDEPVVFSKFTTAVIGPGEPVIVPDSSAKVDYEAELAVVIGRRAKRVSAAQAMDYVLGYTVMNDVTARAFQAADSQWQRSKSCDTFAPMGPFIVTTDEISDPHGLRVGTRVNGVTMQDSNTSQLIFGIPQLIEFLSRTVTLEPGDVIATGTPPGVGVGRTPPVFLKPGDLMEVEVEAIGVLNNPVAA